MICDLEVLQVRRDLTALAREGFDESSEVVGVIDGRLLLAVRLPIDGALSDSDDNTSVLPARSEDDGDATPRTATHPPGVAENGALQGDAAGDRTLGGPPPASPDPLDPVAVLTYKVELIERILHTIVEHPAPRWAGVMRGWLRPARATRLVELPVEQLEKATRDLPTVVSGLQSEARAISRRAARGGGR